MGWRKKKRAGGPLDSRRPYTRFDSNSITSCQHPINRAEYEGSGGNQNPHYLCMKPGTNSILLISTFQNQGCFPVRQLSQLTFSTSGLEFESSGQEREQWAAPTTAGVFYMSREKID